MAETRIQSVFVRRLGAAAAAGWWTFLVAVLIVIVQSIVYMGVAHCAAGRTCLSDMMGMDWGTLRDFICEFILVLRMIVLLMLLGCIFLSLWARRLRRMGDA
jgi:uncharacterized membrane protein